MTEAPFVVWVAVPLGEGWGTPRGGVPKMFNPRFLIGPTEMLEMHHAPFLNQLSALEQKNLAGRSFYGNAGVSIY